MSLSFTAPTNKAFSGALIYLHALERTNATTVTATNPAIVLYGK